MSLTISEAAEQKGISRNAVWLAINRGQVNARKTSGGMWLVEEDRRWADYRPRPYPKPSRGGEMEGGQ